jgi:hypothetical protein
MLANLRSLDQVVVGLIDGYCLGGGVQLAVACDIRVASERAVFAIPASREVGILGGMATWYLPRLRGIGRAKALLLGGAVLNAEQAASWGLIDQVVPVGGLAAAWEQVVAPLSADSLASVAACKHVIETAHDVDYQTAFDDYLRTQDRPLALPAAAIMAQATLEYLAVGKRPYVEVGWFPFGDPGDTYFVETEQWRKVWQDEVDIVFAPKGGGKSAIYSMLVSREGELFDRGIVLVAGENPTGANP